MAGGRPKKYTPEYLADLAASLDEYVASTEIPILKEWCLSEGIPSNHVYDHEEFKESIKACIDKKEVGLERGLLSGAIPPAPGIFSLKQLGWRDKHDVEHTGSITLSFDDALRDV